MGQDDRKLANDLAPTLDAHAANAVSDTSRGPASQGSLAPASISSRFGRYQIVRRLGEGAMGAVYLAHDTQLDRRVALKVPKFTTADGADWRERFYREARAAATLRHANICPVFDVGEIDGRHYISMAFIDGRPLKDFTQSPGPHSPKQIAVIVRKLALALAEAHSHGVVHRDLKPANVMIDGKGEPVVMDFGLARRLGGEDVNVTQSGMLLGTPAYMSPEQAQGDQQAIGPQSDVFSLGVILYELLAGRPPFQGSLLSILKQIALEDPRRPAEVQTNVDPKLEAICLKMIAKDRSIRYGAMNDVARDLGEWLRSVSTVEPTSTVLSPETADFKVVAGRLPYAERAIRRAKWLLTAGIALLCVTALAIFGAVWLRVDDRKTEREATIATGSQASAPAMAPSPPEAPAQPEAIANDNRANSVDAGALGEATSIAEPAAPLVQDFALTFPTLDSQAVLPKIALDSDSPLTIEFWARGFSGSSQEQIFLIMFGSVHMKLFHQESAPTWSAIVVDPTSSKPVQASLSWAWPATQTEPVDTHLAFVRSGQFLALFVNGRPVAKRDRFHGDILRGSGFSIGANGNWDGWIDEIRISKSARYVSEFKPLRRFDSAEQTLALYHCDAGRDNRLTDSSDCGHHGRLVKAKWVKSDGSPARGSSAPATMPIAGLRFDGIDDWAFAPSLALEASDAITIEGFAIPAKASGFFQLAALYGPDAEFRLFSFEGGFGANVFRSGEAEVSGIPNVLAPNRRFHFAATWDGQKTDVYCDSFPGEQRYPEKQAPPERPKNGLVLGTVAIDRGGRPSPQQFFFEGTFEGLRISRGIRYRGPFSPPEGLAQDADTIALYDFRSGGGSICRDATGRGHDGTIHGGAKWISDRD